MAIDPVKGQGAQQNVHNRFDRYSFDSGDEDVDLRKLILLKFSQRL